ncbi:acetyltransferase [Glaciecola petra]|uniref:Acetyltransferase n=1 Tax=Glaciecola petra TaxID=3075602 RepID=A0ABU2ZQH3_9ALTE|nr:acetyltransferase [Aestuariibacter sp. P117]MDT0593854.1 acetyltransferase [Aestuariibacter sp. P117]
MSKIVIFGVSDFAELAHYYLCNDSEHDVVAFCVDGEYLPESKEFCGLPVVSFESVENIYPSNECQFFAPMSPSNMNQDRARIFYAIKDKGYSLISYVSSKAFISNNKIGENCFILEDNTLQPFTDIGDNVSLWSGNHIGHHGRIRDHVSFTSHVVMSGHCDIGEYSFLGVNATLRDGITLAEGTLLAMGGMLTKDTEAWGLYTGAPAQKSRKSSKDIKF